LKLKFEVWNSILLPSTSSPPKELRSKHSTVVEQFFGRSLRPLNLFFARWSKWLKEKEDGVQPLIQSSTVRAARSLAALTVKWFWLLLCPFEVVLTDDI
jgi:hypothetical protein